MIDDGLFGELEVVGRGGDDRGGSGGFGILTEDYGLPGAAGGCPGDNRDPSGGTAGKGCYNVPFLFPQQVAELAGPAGSHDGMNAVLYEVIGYPFESLQVDLVVICKGSDDGGEDSPERRSGYHLFSSWYMGSGDSRSQVKITARLKAAMISAIAVKPRLISLFWLSKRLFISSKRLFTSSKRLFVSSNRLFTSSKRLFTSSK